VLSLICSYVCFLLVPVKRLAGKIIYEMAYTVSSGTLNPAIL